MASATKNLGVPVQTMFHASPKCLYSLKDKDTVGVNIRTGVPPKCPNYDPLGYTECDEIRFFA